MDLTTLGLNRTQSKQTRYFFTHERPFLIVRKRSEGPDSHYPCNWALSYMIDTTQTKYEAREKSLSVELDTDLTPWKLRLERVHRRNVIDAFASKYFLTHEALPSLKESLSLEFSQFNHTHFNRFTSEFAYPFSG